MKKIYPKIVRLVSLGLISAFLLLGYSPNNVRADNPNLYPQCILPDGTWSNGQLGFHDWGFPQTGGYDMWAPEGTPIFAPYDGTISDACAIDGMGNPYMNIISDDGNWRLLLMHMSSCVGNGHYKEGDVIGYVGAVGNSGGIPHVHISGKNLQTGEILTDLSGLCNINGSNPDNLNIPSSNIPSSNTLVEYYLQFLRQSPEARALLLTIARHESGYNFHIKNSNSSAYGFFQIIDSTNQELIAKGFPDDWSEIIQLAKGAYLFKSRVEAYTNKDPTTFLKELTQEELSDFLNQQLQCEWAGTPGTCLQSRGFDNQYYPKNYGFSSWEEAQEEFWKTYKENLEICEKGEDIISEIIGAVQNEENESEKEAVSLEEYLSKHPDLVLVNNTFRNQGEKGPEECRDGELWFMEGSLRQTPLPEKANAYTCNKGHWDKIQTFNLEGVNLEKYRNKRVLPDTQQQQYKLPDYLRNSLQISSEGSVIFNPKEQWFSNYEQNPFSFFLIPEIDQNGNIPFYQLQIEPGVILTFRKEEGSFNLSEIYVLQREIYSSLMDRKNIEINYGWLVKIELPYSELEELISKNP